jgi:hypothetical protein
MSSSFFTGGNAYTQVDSAAVEAFKDEAEAAAASALSSKLASAASAAAAAASATSAATSAANAATSEANAATSEDNAADSATTASTAAATATGQATIATTQAGNAATSATAASGSATAAAGSATTASTQAGNASASATAAAGSATAAATSATNAAAAVQAAAGTATPLVDGVAAVGVGTKWAREDHKHPTDTSLAPLASPALTGNPTAPTQSAGNNSTRLATTAYVDTADALKAPLASPTFTGTPAAPTATAGTNTTQIATTAFVLANATSRLPPRWWSGGQHSNNVTSPNSKLDISSGKWRDSTDAVDITGTSGLIDTGVIGANGLDASGTWTSARGYTFAIMKADLTFAFLASLSPTAPTLPSGYTYFRRIGMFKTDSSGNILAFTHVNNMWAYTTPIRDVASTSMTANTVTAKVLASVPFVQGVTALFSPTIIPASGTSIVFDVMPGFMPDAATSAWRQDFEGLTAIQFMLRIAVNSSGQIKYRPNAVNHTLVVDTAGWIDDL